MPYQCLRDEAWSSVLSKIYTNYIFIPCSFPTAVLLLAAMAVAMLVVNMQDIEGNYSHIFLFIFLFLKGNQKCMELV